MLDDRVWLYSSSACVEHMSMCVGWACVSLEVVQPLSLLSETHVRAVLRTSRLLCGLIDHRIMPIARPIFSAVRAAWWRLNVPLVFGGSQHGGSGREAM